MNDAWTSFREVYCAVNNIPVIPKDASPEEVQAWIREHLLKEETDG